MHVLGYGLDLLRSLRRDVKLHDEAILIYREALS